MNLTLRIFLIVGAALVFLVVTRWVRRERIQMADAVFWIVLGFLILLNAIFPELTFWLSTVLGFASPSNFVFLIIIGLLLIKSFSDASQISKLKHKVTQLSQEIALDKRARQRARHAVAGKARKQAPPTASASGADGTDGAGGAGVADTADAADDTGASDAADASEKDC